MAFPIFRVPQKNVRGDSEIAFSINPIVSGFSSMAPAGQTKLQPPQPWQREGNERIFLGRAARALYLQKLEHFLQSVHFSGLISGTRQTTSSTGSSSNPRNRLQLGSSTSQSKSCTSPRARARFTATVVFPVPPLPLAIAIFMSCNFPLGV